MEFETCSRVFSRRSILVLASVISLTLPLTSAGILSFKLPIPLLSFLNPLQIQHQEPHPVAHQHHHPASSQHLHHHHPHDHQVEHIHDIHHHHNHVLDHAHLDQEGKLYFHDPDSTVQFFYKENLHGHSKRVDVHHEGCQNAPLDYWYNRPKSLWAKHCITLYQTGNCHGEGAQVAGLVTELRSAGLPYGFKSFKPCEKNIRIRFMPPANQKAHHHHH